jgi:HD-GYP domain-containing protein (c-di-GMP phosphodiesterase class II)
MPAPEVSTVRRAGWLHDVGRIAVSASVWEKPGPLTAHQWEQVRLHPYYTDRVLDRTPFLRQLAAVASAHHERADGRGYFRGVRGSQMSLAARVLAAADTYHSMTEPRPYRAPLPAKVAAKELRNDVDAGGLDAQAADAVLYAAGERSGRRRSAAPAGLTAREVDILQQVVRGLSIKQIARVLTIAPKTVDGHLQRIYAKVGVSTRAGATLFAIQHDLVSIEDQNGENSL